MADSIDIARIKEMRNQGFSDSEIARSMSVSTSELRALISMSNNEQKQTDLVRVKQLKEQGLSNVAIGKQIGVSEASIRRALLRRTDGD